MNNLEQEIFEMRIMGDCITTENPAPGRPKGLKRIAIGAMAVGVFLLPLTGKADGGDRKHRKQLGCTNYESKAMVWKAPKKGVTAHAKMVADAMPSVSVKFEASMEGGINE